MITILRWFGFAIYLWQLKKVTGQLQYGQNDGTEYLPLEYLAFTTYNVAHNG